MSWDQADKVVFCAVRRCRALSPGLRLGTTMLMLIWAVPFETASYYLALQPYSFCFGPRTSTVVRSENRWPRVLRRPKSKVQSLSRVSHARSPIFLFLSLILRPPLPRVFDNKTPFKLRHKMKMTLHVLITVLPTPSLLSFFLSPTRALEQRLSTQRRHHVAAVCSHSHLVLVPLCAYIFIHSSSPAPPRS